MPVLGVLSLGILSLRCLLQIHLSTRLTLQLGVRPCIHLLIQPRGSSPSC